MGVLQPRQLRHASFYAYFELCMDIILKKCSLYPQVLHNCLMIIQSKFVSDNANLLSIGDQEEDMWLVKPSFWIHGVSRGSGQPHEFTMYTQGYSINPVFLDGYQLVIVSDPVNNTKRINFSWEAYTELVKTDDRWVLRHLTFTKIIHSRNVFGTFVWVW